MIIKSNITHESIPWVSEYDSVSPLHGTTPPNGSSASNNAGNNFTIRLYDGTYMSKCFSCMEITMLLVRKREIPRTTNMTPTCYEWSLMARCKAECFWSYKLLFTNTICIVCKLVLVMNS